LAEGGTGEKQEAGVETGESKEEEEKEEELINLGDVWEEGEDQVG